MILRRANIYDATDIAKVHVKVWNEFHKERVSEPFLKHFNFEYRKKYWVRFINENRICFVVEEKGGSIDGFVVPGLKRLNENENVGEILMHYVNDNQHYEQNFASLLLASAMLFQKNNANTMFTWIHREHPSIEKYKGLGGVETSAKVDRMDSKDIIKIKLEWTDLEKLNEENQSILDNMIVEF